MVRQYFPQEPMSRLAVWSRRCAIFGIEVAALSVVVVRSNLLEMRPALATFGAALIFAALAMLLGLFAFIGIWRRGLGGLGSAVAGIFLGLTLLAYPAYLGTRAYRLPAINDITTDPANPPRLEASARFRARGTTYPGAPTAERQRTAYPDIEPLSLATSPKLAYDIALALVNKRKWQVLGERPPAGRGSGTIEAVARSTVMGFRDDVVIRVSADGPGARVDVRSSSRFDMHDFGDNAARVRLLLEDIDAAANSAPPQKKPEPEKKPQPKRPGRR